ncbi:MAG TPA: TetR/AcrR family transcriptional regulator, partial [Mycobacteriales bacterium]|nr:TetR/AcrR family transcriptional regulator [Mycobacteriales bacterium]
AGVAKGTLYNHFRTKDAVYSAALDTGVRSLAEECVVVAADDLAEALALAAERLSNVPALRRIATDEPAVLASLTSIGAGREWESVRQAVRATLIAAGRTSTDPAVDVVLRWLVSFVGNPGRDVETQARLVAAAVPDVPAVPVVPVVPATSAVAGDDTAAD